MCVLPNAGDRGERGLLLRKPARVRALWAAERPPWRMWGEPPAASTVAPLGPSEGGAQARPPEQGRLTHPCAQPNGFCMHLRQRHCATTAVRGISQCHAPFARLHEHGVAGEITANVSKIPVHLPADLPNSKRKRVAPGTLNSRAPRPRTAHRIGRTSSSDSPRNAAGLGKGLESLYCSIQAAE